MKIPKYHSVPKLEFPDEPNNEAWTVLLSRSMSLIMREVQSEWQLRSKNQVLQALVAFALHQLSNAGEDLVDPEGRAFARLRAAQALAEAKAQRAILIRLNDLLVTAAETTDAAVEKALRGSAKDLAEAYELPWPPPEPTVLDRTPGARAVLGRLSGIFGEGEQAKISLRDLSRSVNRGKDDLIPILETLAEAGYIQLEKESRSGPETVWISGPRLLA